MTVARRWCSSQQHAEPLARRRLHRQPAGEPSTKAENKAAAKKPGENKPGEPDAEEPSSDEPSSDESSIDAKIAAEL